MSETDVALEIIGKHVGEFVTRIRLSSGSYVVAHMDGRYTCVHSQCVGKGAGALDCEHVRFVREHDTPDAGEGTAVDNCTPCNPATGDGVAA